MCRCFHQLNLISSNNRNILKNRKWRHSCEYARLKFIYKREGENSEEARECTTTKSSVDLNANWG